MFTKLCYASRLTSNNRNAISTHDFFFFEKKGRMLRAQLMSLAWVYNICCTAHIHGQLCRTRLSQDLPIVPFQHSSCVLHLSTLLCFYLLPFPIFVLLPSPVFKAWYVGDFYSDLPDYWLFKDRKYVSQFCLLRCGKLKALPIRKQEIWKPQCGFSVPLSNFYTVRVRIPLFVLKIFSYKIVRSILQISDTINGPKHLVEIKSLSKHLDFLTFVANMEDIYKKSKQFWN